MVNYFFDSYAFIEIIKDNSKYFVYSYEPVVLTIFNLVEIYAFLLKELGQEKSDAIYEKLKKGLVEVDDKTIKEAIKLKIKHSKNNLSYTDCIGYTYAKQNHLLFLTGDKEFEKMPNVEYVK